METENKREKLLFIINPRSGTGKMADLENILTGRTDQDKYDIFVEKTAFAGHARKLAKQYIKNGFKKIVAVGGDGTVNEVASSLVGSKATLGIIPAGSGNGLARDLGIPVSIYKAIEVINQPRIRKIDVGKMNKKYFFCTCGTGFDARIGERFGRNNKRGFLNYVKTAFREFFSYRPKKYSLKIDGKKYNEKAFLITLANAGQYGNNAYISPGAEIDDGLLDICIVKPFPKHKAFSIGFRLFNRTMDKSRFVEVIRGKKVSIKRKKKIHIHIDGDPVKPKKEIKAEIIPGSLKVMTPYRVNKNKFLPKKT